MAVKIHTNYYKANLEKRNCDECNKAFIVGQELKNEITYCPYCGSKHTDEEAWTDDDLLKDMDLGCLDICFCKE